MQRRTSLACLAAILLAGTAWAASALSEDDKLEVCDQVASYLDDDSSYQSWEEATCLASEIKILKEDESEVSIEFRGSLLPRGRKVRCTLIAEKPLSDFAPFVEQCSDID